MTAPRIRFYCLALPGDAPQLGFDYLEALHQAGLAVKACPIGPMFLHGRWPELMHLFVGADMPDGRYVNVVCAPIGLPLGYASTRAASGPPIGVVPGVATRDRDVVYAPQTALAGLYTVGAPNVALVMAPRAEPPGGELQALTRYQRVCAPTESEATKLHALGVAADAIPPQSLPTVLRAMVDAL